MPARLQRRRTKGWRMPAGAVYVGRPSRWGNPFAVDATTPTRDAAVARYRSWLATQPELVAAARSALAGRDLVCWCPPGEACHADVLLDVANPGGAAIADRDVHRDRAPVRVPVLCEFRVPERDWAASRLDTVEAWPIGGLVLDAGCGPGAYVPVVLERIGPRGAVVGFDVGAERVRAAGSVGADGIVGDVGRLPFADGAFDAAMALHMLYHVPDIPAAVRELRRVVRDGGFLLVTTNAGDDEEEVLELFRAAGGTESGAFGDWRFCIENAEPFLRSAFDRVEVHLEESQFVVRDVAPVTNTFDSMRYQLEPGLDPSLPWATFLARVGEEAQRVIAADGAFVVHARTGIFVCS